MSFVYSAQKNIWKIRRYSLTCGQPCLLGLGLTGRKFFNLDKAFPIAVIVHLPIKGPGHAALPIILTEGPQTNTGIDTVCWDAVEWASQISGQLGTVSVRKHVGTLCKFMNFFHLYSKEQKLLSVRDQTVSIFAFLDFRITGTRHLSHDHPLKPLGWEGCAKHTVRAEFNYLTRYFCFLENYIGNNVQSLDHRLFKLPSDQLDHLRKKNNDFLMHLASYRNFWADLNEDEIEFPRRFRPTNREIGYRPFPDEDEIRLIIAAEKNPAFKAIWLIQAYGASHRISEVLNVWQDDILPSSYNREFFGSPADGMPLVLIAHPTESTWIGTSNSRKQTRQTYLLNRYGILPRSERPETDPLFAGFKTKRVYGLYKSAKTRWLSSEAAIAFGNCAQEIPSFHISHRTSRKHPYFFVNMFARDDRHGEPITKSRIDKAWIAACARVGVSAHQRGRNIHGLRHFTKYYAEQMGIPASMIQVMRGDNSEQSQNDYGKCAKAVHYALTSQDDSTEMGRSADERH